MAVLSSPINEDARVYSELLAIAQGGVQVDARSWFFREFAAGSYEELSSRYPVDGREYDLLYNLLSFYESVAALVSRGLLHEDVFFDAPLGFDAFWEKAGAALQDWRKSTEESKWDGVVWLGRRFEGWRKYVWKSKLDALPPEKPVRRRQG